MEVKVLELFSKDRNQWRIIGVHYTLRSVDDEIAVLKLTNPQLTDDDFNITDWAVNGYIDSIG